MLPVPCSTISNISITNIYLYMYEVLKLPVLRYEQWKEAFYRRMSAINGDGLMEFKKKKITSSKAASKGKHHQCMLRPSGQRLLRKWDICPVLMYQHKDHLLMAKRERFLYNRKMWGSPLSQVIQVSIINSNITWHHIPYEGHRIIYEILRPKMCNVHMKKPFNLI